VSILGPQIGDNQFQNMPNVVWRSFAKIISVDGKITQVKLQHSQATVTSEELKVWTSLYWAMTTPVTLLLLFTHRRSIAERGGCFQRRLFVSLFVNTITSERLNVGQWNLAVRCTAQKSRPSSNVKVKGQRLRSPGTKNEKVRYFVWQPSSGALLHRWGKSAHAV